MVECLDCPARLVETVFGQSTRPKLVFSGFTICAAQGPRRVGGPKFRVFFFFFAPFTLFVSLWVSSCGNFGGV